MSGIFVVAFLVHCGQSLLLCAEIDTRELRFRDMAACRAQLGDLIAGQRQSAGAAQVVMGKCRYLLVDPPHHPTVARLPPPGRLPSNAAALAANDRQGIVE